MPSRVSQPGPVTTADRIFLSMRQDIVEGVIVAGSKLSETELAQRFGVSRAVIRESISRLETSRLIERKPNVGARVISLTQLGLSELYWVREALEGMAARQAASAMTDAEIASLEQLLQSHSSQVTNDQAYYQDAGNEDFHYRIIVGSKNQHLIQLLSETIYHLIRMYRVQLGMSGPRVTTALEEHQQIVKAIQARDPELAELLMRRHIASTRIWLERKLVEQA